MKKYIIFAILLCSMYCACMMTSQESLELARINQSLHEAALYGDSKRVRVALQQGAYVNWQNHFFFNDTPLHAATAGDYIDVAQQLLLYPGIDVNVRGLTGKTSLHMAVTKDNESIVKLLLSDPTIDVNILDNTISTPLHDAVLRGHKAIVELLLLHPGIDIDVQNGRGSTALMIALFKDHKIIDEQLVDRLLDRGASVHIKNNVGRTAIDLASGKLKAKLQSLAASQSNVGNKF